MTVQEANAPDGGRGAGRPVEVATSAAATRAPDARFGALRRRKDNSFVAAVVAPVVAAVTAP